MITALEGVEGSASRPVRSLPPGKTRYPLYRRLGGPQGRSGQVRKISPPPGFAPRTVQSVASLLELWYLKNLMHVCVLPPDFGILGSSQDVRRLYLRTVIQWPSVKRLLSLCIYSELFAVISDIVVLQFFCHIFFPTKFDEILLSTAMSVSRLFPHRVVHEIYGGQDLLQRWTRMIVMGGRIPSV